MSTFEDFKIKKQLFNALTELGIEQPTPIQEASYSTILGGSDFVGIAQTGTGKTMAYLLPILQDLKFSKDPHPRILILAPTRELVIQIVEQIEQLTAYITVRVVGVYGGSSNINRQKQAVAEGVDILVGTPRRLYDLALTNVLRLKSIKKLVIDEVDVMLDFGYKTQLKHIFEYLPEKRQNILFSATMTPYVDGLIDDFLVNPVKQTMAVSGTPVETITQEAYAVPNFYTKVNLLNHLLSDKETHHKVLIFIRSKAIADKLAETLDFFAETSVIHSRKEQNHRVKSIEKFEEGTSRILVATDVIARGIDIDNISTVINFDTPMYPENYIHRIGRTGRAGQEGHAILLFSEKEVEFKEAIEDLMNYRIPLRELPEEVSISEQLIPEEKDKPKDWFEEEPMPAPSSDVGPSFHEKLPKNNREKQEKKSYGQKMKEKYKKPIRKGDKIQNLKKKKRKKR
ncbi:DEAD/DEAH box helicase [Algivirga pacifica]|uniref:DEAD/DEAH box helicase n=1 Tax=Algivirga pacifica TaxID=1162670 RepID=A0ABP9DRG7_9BACT